MGRYYRERGILVMGFVGGAGFATGTIVVDRATSVALTIPAPAISLAVAEDHSGGAFTSTPALTIPIPIVAEVVAEDHSGGGFASTPSLNIPAPTISGVAEVV